MAEIHAGSAAQHRAGIPFVEALEIAVEAYTYAYPLVLMDAARRMTTNVPSADCERGSGAPLNQFTHMRRLPDTTPEDLERPNTDVLHSALWFDVSSEPLIISVPDSDGRFYALSLLDLWSEVFASPGTRTTGPGAQTFGITGPNWLGSLPPVIRTYRSPTALGWLIGLTQVNGPGDLAAVARFQAGLSATPWSAWGHVYTPPVVAAEGETPATDPVDFVARLSSNAFFSRFAELTRRNPPHAQDYPLTDRMRRIGLVPGRGIDVQGLSREVQLALEKAPLIAQSNFRAAYAQSLEFVNHWRGVNKPRGVYGSNYGVRAGVAFTGLGAGTNEDSLCFDVNKDASGDPFDSARSYTLSFAKGHLPPSNAFWSLTLYDDRQRFAPNILDRYSLGDRAGSVTGSDGSTTLYIQRDPPSSFKQRNWLPAPAAGGFSLSLRLYWPKSPASTGGWFPAAVQPAHLGTSGDSD